MTRSGVDASSMISVPANRPSLNRALRLAIEPIDRKARRKVREQAADFVAPLLGVAVPCRPDSAPGQIFTPLQGADRCLAVATHGRPDRVEKRAQIAAFYCSPRQDIGGGVVVVLHERQRETERCLAQKSN
jgi:hypothetical protein